MKVAYFQMAIIVSIVAAYFLANLLTKSFKNAITAAFALSILWSIWTTIMVYTPKLRIVQLFFIWSTMCACWYISRKRIEIDYLRNRLQGYNDKKIERIKKIMEKSDLEVITGDQHREVLLNSLITAERAIYILSGWATIYVIDVSFKKILRDALMRGVNIYLGFGWISSNQKYEPKPHETEAREILNRAATWAENVPNTGKLFVAEYPNHSKILICDDKFAVCGSCNWLSNNSFNNEERSWKILDNDFIHSEANEISANITAEWAKSKVVAIQKLEAQIDLEIKSRQKAEARAKAEAEARKKTEARLNELERAMVKEKQ